MNEPGTAHELRGDPWAIAPNYDSTVLYTNDDIETRIIPGLFESIRQSNIYLLGNGQKLVHL